MGAHLGVATEGQHRDHIICLQRRRQKVDELFGCLRGDGHDELRRLLTTVLQSRTAEPSAPTLPREIQEQWRSLPAQCRRSSAARGGPGMGETHERGGLCSLFEGHTWSANVMADAYMATTSADAISGCAAMTLVMASPNLKKAPAFWN